MNIAILDQLVRLASFGTAGVCILAIFYIGYIILKLGPQPSVTHVKLVKQYMMACIIIAVISATSGVLNAYWNQQKIGTAEEKYDNLKSNYINEYQSIYTLKNSLQKELNSFRQNWNTYPTLINPDITDIQNKIDSLYIKPPNEMFKDNAMIK